MKTRFYWIDNTRKDCCDTKTFIKTFIPKVPDNWTVSIHVYVCDIIFQVLDEHGMWKSIKGYEFFTS